MTFFDFADRHPILALLFAGLAFALPIVLTALLVSWRVTRPVKFTAEDRKALTSAAARLRHAALKWAGAEHWATRDAAREEADALERMAGQ